MRTRPQNLTTACAAASLPSCAIRLMLCCAVLGSSAILYAPSLAASPGASEPAVAWGEVLNSALATTGFTRADGSLHEFIADGDRHVMLRGHAFGYFTGDLNPQLVVLAAEWEPSTLSDLICHIVVLEPVIANQQLRWTRVVFYENLEAWGCAHLVGLEERRLGELDLIKLSACLNDSRNQEHDALGVLSLEGYEAVVDVQTQEKPSRSDDEWGCGSSEARRVVLNVGRSGEAQRASLFLSQDYLAARELDKRLLAGIEEILEEAEFDTVWSSSDLKRRFNTADPAAMRRLIQFLEAGSIPYSHVSQRTLSLDESSGTTTVLFGSLEEAVVVDLGSAHPGQDGSPK